MDQKTINKGAALYTLSRESALRKLGEGLPPEMLGGAMPEASGGPPPFPPKKKEENGEKKDEEKDKKKDEGCD
jgi:hypothetical protein